MHRDQLLSVDFTPVTDFLITSSIEGVVKFWKKISGGIEFVKEFRAHNGEIHSTSVSADGRSYASAGSDKTIKIFDVITFGKGMRNLSSRTMLREKTDLLAMIQLDEVPACICWVHTRGASIPLLAVSFQTNNEIRIYDARGTTEEPIHVIKKLHRKIVTAMTFNNTYDCVVSADEGGMLEYWSPSSNYEKPSNVFEMKSSTNLFEFKKVSSHKFYPNMS
jgi:peptidylprolyl isomerase domain and WD repeat-containing protein 1